VATLLSEAHRKLLMVVAARGHQPEGRVLRGDVVRARRGAEQATTDLFRRHLGAPVAPDGPGCERSADRLAGWLAFSHHPKARLDPLHAVDKVHWSHRV